MIIVGQRFRYSYYDKTCGEIWQSIETLDKKVRIRLIFRLSPTLVIVLINVTLLYLQGMDIIESMDPVAFSEYLKKYQNTICGRHPIGILLNVSFSQAIYSIKYVYNST